MRQLPVAAYQTFAITADAPGLTRPATCAEVECDAYLLGWTTTLDTSTEPGQRAVAFLAAGAGGRHYRETTLPGFPLRTFVFEPGQLCFRAGEHRIAIRPARFARWNGWHGQRVGEIRPYDRPDQWVDDFATHQQRLVDTVREG